MARTTTTRDAVDEARAVYAAAGKTLADARAKVDAAKTNDARRKAQRALAMVRSDWNDARVAMLRAESDEAAAGTNAPARSTSSSTSTEPPTS